MKTLLFLLAMALVPGWLSPARAGIYFAAHQDDLILLMGRSALVDIRANAPTVLVVLTAGDGGNGPAPVTVTGIGMRYYNQMGNPYYRVRHNANEAAIGVWLHAGHSRIPQRSTEYFSSAAPAVEKVRLGNVLMYNLNLPDGLLDRLQTNAAGSLKDVTGINSYTADGLRELLRLIVSRNGTAAAAAVGTSTSTAPVITATAATTPATAMGPVTLLVHLPEHTPLFIAPGYNEAREAQLRGDHPDHTAAGRLVREALGAPGFGCVRQYVYMGYGISAGPDSMSASEKLAQVAAYTALDQVLRNQGNMTFRPELRDVLPGALDGFHMGFFGKQRWRDGGGGKEPCAFAARIERGEWSHRGRRLQQ